MANVNFSHATLRLKYVEGYNDQNEPTYITKSYRNLTKTHNVDDLVTVAHAMVPVFHHKPWLVLKSKKLANYLKGGSEDGTSFRVTICDSGW
ncbi:DUF1659 domain-containing protein [Lysinibacillus fusiformis]